MVLPNHRKKDWQQRESNSAADDFYGGLYSTLAVYMVEKIKEKLGMKKA